MVSTEGSISRRKETHREKASAVRVSGSGQRGAFREVGRVAYLKIGKIRTIKVSDFSVIDYVSTIFCMSSHGSSTIALIVASIDLFSRETESSSSDWRWLEHCAVRYN